MKLVCISLFFSALVLFAKTDSSPKHRATLKHSYTSYEKVLMGVLILKEDRAIPVQKKRDLYQQLLATSGITHEEFRTYIDGKSSRPNQWYSTVKGLNAKVSAD